MNTYNGRLILKVKKRRSSLPLPGKKVCAEKENQCVTSQPKSLKRPNPFSKTKTDCESKDKCKKFINYDTKDIHQSNLLTDLSNLSQDKRELRLSDSKEPSYELKDVIKEKKDEVTEDANSENVIYESSQVPFNWMLKQKLKFFSKKPFLYDIKSSHEPKAIHNFTSSSDQPDEPLLNQHLYNWIHPSLPGIPNYPLKTTVLGGSSKEEKNCINLFANNMELRDIIMKEWRKSFQSLYNMLKTSYCPYFYICGHQFSVLFKSSSVGHDGMCAVLGPTTKGLRDLLSQEGLNFDFIYTRDEESVDEIEYGFEDEAKQNKESSDKAPSSLNTSCDEDFFDSIGLSQKEHFPQMEQQQRRALRSKLNSLDSRPESTVRIKNCNGLFNFLLNANFLCAASGPMTGVPPTLLSPEPFESATLNKLKANIPPKQTKKVNSNTVYTVDINGTMLPCQFYHISKILTQHNDVNIQSVPCWSKVYQVDRRKFLSKTVNLVRQNARDGTVT
uniref:Uncharacterized protein n=1 Tax=Clytia hemisphaerica TaxID=252671 RepID=A0A7M5WXI6_9CNID